MSSFTISNVQSPVTCESRRVPSRRSVYLAPTNLLHFSHYFHASCVVLFTVYFHVPLLHFSLCAFTL